MNNSLILSITNYTDKQSTVSNTIYQLNDINKTNIHTHLSNQTITKYINYYNTKQLLIHSYYINTLITINTLIMITNHLNHIN